MARRTQRTRVGIVGAGPAGLLLSQLLHLEGIDSVVVEDCSRAHVEERVRAGVLEQGTVDLLREIGAGQRLGRLGLAHHGFELRFARKGHRIDMYRLTGGRCITVYGQNEVVKDLLELRQAAGGEIHFGVENVGIAGFAGGEPTVRFRKEGEDREIACDFIAGCDGAHGVCRECIPEGALTLYRKDYPFGWLGILAHASPSSDELIYANHEKGFALHSMRSPAVTRLYLQCNSEENLADWPDSRIWEELAERLETSDGFSLRTGPILQKSVTPLRSFVCEPMQYGRLFLAGDAAHIVPPTGAKGLNLAAADVRVLGRALTRYYRTGETQALEEYSRECLRRVWRVQHFSWWMTSMLHRFPGMDRFDRRRQLAELDTLTSSEAACRYLAENYSGLPFANPRPVAG